jgi:hypothetical protein
VGTQRANKNLRKFVERQIVSLQGEWRENERIKTVGGKQVWWETKGDGKIVSFVTKRYVENKVLTHPQLQPGNIEIESVEKGGNGEVWIVKGVLGDG